LLGGATETLLSQTAGTSVRTNRAGRVSKAPP